VVRQDPGQRIAHPPAETSPPRGDARGADGARLEVNEPEDAAPLVHELLRTEVVAVVHQAASGEG
jgi:hypothetical protein